MSKMKYIQFSEQGPRLNNEDCCSIIEIPGKRTLFVLCDGMGGHFGGEIASRTVCDIFTAYWREYDLPDSPSKVLAASRQASAAIDKQPSNRQMGTTLVMVSVEGSQATIAHAGDSRCYVVDIKGHVKYRTIDHDEVNDFGYKVITRSFFTGYPEDAVPEIRTLQLSPLDRILLCSDGLYNALDDETLLHTLQCAKDVEQVTEKYKTICQNKADDNYTAIIIEIE